MEFTGERVVLDKTPHRIYEEHIARYQFSSRFVRDKVVLDVACGTGYGSSHLLRHGAKKVVGVDMSKDAINYAKEQYNDEYLSFEQMDATELKFPDDFFDVVVSFETIEHLPNYKQFLLEVNRVLKTEGTFIVSTPNRQIHSPLSKRPLNEFHIKEFTEDEFYNALNKNFKDINLFGQNVINIYKFWIKLLLSKKFYFRIFSSITPTSRELRPV